MADLPWNRCACPSCAMPVSDPGVAQLHCGSCQRQPWPFDFVIAPLLYSFPVNGMLKALKYRRRVFHAPPLAAILHQSVGDKAEAIDAVVPVPLHWSRHRERGFNQAAELARPLARRLGLPLWQGVRRARATPPQSGLTERERHRNLANAFELRGQAPCRSVLIVDDVITTGATVRRLGRTLRRAGVTQLAVVAVARAVAGRA
jgi:ComF family protein